MAVIRHWPLHQLDIKNVFLHGDVKKEVFMEQLLEFFAQKETYLACRLRKFLYGLKQFPQVWLGRFSKVIQDLGICNRVKLIILYFIYISLILFAYI